MVLKTADEVNNIIKDILLATGTDKRNADRVAEALVSAELCGHSTHGLWHLPIYVNCIKKGEIRTSSWPEIINETPNSALVKGNYTFGLTTAKFAMELAINKSKKNKFSIVGGTQVNHTGRLGEYAEMAAKERMISLIFSGGFSEVTPTCMPYGGAKKVLYTNPFAMGFPAGEESPVISDFATTTIAGTKVGIALDRKQKLPPNCIVDKEGRSTSDPKDFFEGGGHIPFGKHKGFAVMLANEFLGRIFTGADLFIDGNLGGPLHAHSGFTMIVFNADIFNLYNNYAESMDEMERRIREVPPAPGFKEVLLPGDIEKKTRKERLNKGIPVADDLWKVIIDLGESLGLSIK